MLDKNVKDLLNKQINTELYSAYLYLDFANYYYDQGLDGFANWYDVQAKEERDHAMMIRDYILDNGESVVFEAIENPTQEYEAIDTALHLSLQHERYITGLINKIYKAASDVDDYRTMQFFDWFVKEQMEEEKNADDLVKKFELFGKDSKGLYALNQELLARSYAAPAITE
ncbi:MAG: ferritin [Eubacterium sp.]|nr:ferritin [Eubacterium sp.]